MALLSRFKKSSQTPAASAKPVRHAGNRTGRYVSATESGRVTPRTTKSNTSSPAWYGKSMLGLLGTGVAIISMNYLHALPGSVSSWYLLIGLAAIFAGFFMATRYK
ncbi:unannotated protein [freshwater metagenome]|uniref:Unannotated protein n=1 Tax=freshwater metagenome TaxID=449393 RepID=A0A6J7DML9_9ZZZZ|nr:cell division protein CrgA [Actinomycetota bacterium]